MVRELTGGPGAESVIEAVGVDQTTSDALGCAAAGGNGIGRRSQFQPGVPLPDIASASEPVDLPGHPRVCPEHLARASFNTPHRIASGRIHPEDVFTHQMPLGSAANAY